MCGVIVRAACALLALQAAMAASAGRPLAADDLFRIQEVSEPQVSPDGTDIAYLVSHNDRDADERRTTLWLVGWAGGDPGS